MKQHILNLIIPYVKAFPNKNSTELAQIVLDKEPGINISHRTARYYIGNVKKDVSIVVTPLSDSEGISDDDFTSTLSSDTSDTLSLVSSLPKVSSDYNITVDNDVTHYNFSLRDGAVVTMTEEVVNTVFCAYSRAGLNYTKPQIVDSLGISYQDFGILTNKLNLSKFSPTLGPHSISSLSEKEQYSEVLRLSTSLIDKFNESDNGTAEALIKEYKKKLLTLSSMETIKENQMKSLIASLPSIKIQTHDFETNVSSYNGNLQVVLTDMHIGMETNNFNFSIARQQITNMIDIINTEVLLHGIERVTLLLLGDLPHTISGLNHMNNWKDIESNFWGADAIIKPFELLALLAANVLNLTGIYAVGGKVIASNLKKHALNCWKPLKV